MMERRAWLCASCGLRLHLLMVYSIAGNMALLTSVLSAGWLDCLQTDRMPADRSLTYPGRVALTGCVAASSVCLLLSKQI